MAASDFEAIHPELRNAARRMPMFTLGRGVLFLFRVALALLPAPKAPNDMAIVNLRIPNPNIAGKIRLRIYRPRAESTPLPLLLWIHGGGYVMGKPELDDAVCCQYAREAGVVVVSVDYRLAPAHPFPAALHDVHAALQWVRAHAAQLRIDPQRFAIGGASAGAGLAAALAQLTHDRGDRALLQLLIYPMLDDRPTREAERDAAYVGWSSQNNRFAWQAYLRKTPDPGATPYAVPARRADLSGLAPAWIGVGSMDLFKDENVVYAQRLRAAGVDCELLMVPGAFHGFDVRAAALPVVRDFRRSQVAALVHSLQPR